jgi:hypothetical protein
MQSDPKQTPAPQASPERDDATTPKRPYKAPRLEKHEQLHKIGVGYN